VLCLTAVDGVGVNHGFRPRPRSGGSWVTRFAGPALRSTPATSSVGRQGLEP